MDDKVHWLQVKFTCNGEIAEALAELLGRFVANGVVVENVTLINPHTQENEPTGELDVFGYLPVDENLEEKKQRLEEALWHLGQIAPVPKPEYTQVKDEDWMAAWKQHYNPIPIGEHFLILPAWLQPENEEGRIIVKINPAMAFGTGTHPTTQLCLQMFERHFEPGQSVIDVGCGSGILSIAALRMGASHVLAVDVDGQAVLSTIENAGLNDISPLDIEVSKGSVTDILADKFSIKEAPVVLVNILAPIIIQLFSHGLGEIVSDGGTLLLSGLLDHQEEEVIQAAKTAGFSVIDHLSQDDWVSLAMKKT
jgi:ribosomal protein L11 methyltransferase